MSESGSHGPDCICPGICQEWVLTNAGLGFHNDGTPVEAPKT